MERSEVILRSYVCMYAHPIYYETQRPGPCIDGLKQKKPTSGRLPCAKGD